MDIFLNDQALFLQDLSRGNREDLLKLSDAKD